MQYNIPKGITPKNELRKTNYYHVAFWVCDFDERLGWGIPPQSCF
jgi:hypothetical protein